MNLYERANKDVQKITGNGNEWGVEITMTAPNGQIAVLNGIHTKHFLGVNTEGNMVSSKTAHISVSEQNIINANAYYPIRNLNNEVDFKNHLIYVKDSTGVIKKYSMQKWLPDETIGLINCIIEDYEA